MKHIAALDGVRGVAVLLVMLFHLHIPGFALGWAGVPLFFCLSGFLITGILNNNRGQGITSYMASFLINRSLRIFPLFYAYLIVNYVLLSISGNSHEGYLSFIFYLQNYYIGLFGQSPGVLGHTWTLAVEEQFYWFWPLVIFFVPKKHQIKLFVPLIVLSLLSRPVIFSMTGQSPYMINVTLISCADMLILGALFSSIKDECYSPKVAKVTFTAGLLLTAYAFLSVGYSAFWMPELWAGKCWYLFTGLGMIFSSLIFLVYHQSKYNDNKLLIKLLNLKPLTFTGKISYGLYMWHMLCFHITGIVFNKLGFSKSGPLWFMVAIVTSYIVAIISFYYFEIHFLKLKRKNIQVLKPSSNLKNIA